MESLLPLMGLAIVLFVSTNIDDVFVLLAFFADPRTRTRDIVIGQFLGIGALYAVSVIASLVSLVISEQYIGLLGIVPVLIGLAQLRGLWRLDDQDDVAVAQGFAASGGRILAVAGITIANGGDNIGVYTPIFATRSAFEIALIGAVFAVLTGVWCVLARSLIAHPTLGAPIRRYGRYVVPFVLIGLGLLVLWEAGSIGLLRG